MIKMHNPFSTKKLFPALVLIFLLSACGQSSEFPAETNATPSGNTPFDY